MSVVTLMMCLYVTRVNDTFRYPEWDRDHPDGKAAFVLREGASSRLILGRESDFQGSGGGTRSGGDVGPLHSCATSGSVGLSGCGQRAISASRKACNWPWPDRKIRNTICSLGVGFSDVFRATFGAPNRYPATHKLRLRNG